MLSLKSVFSKQQKSFVERALMKSNMFLFQTFYIFKHYENLWQTFKKSLFWSGKINNTIQSKKNTFCMRNSHLYYSNLSIEGLKIYMIWNVTIGKGFFYCWRLFFNKKKSNWTEHGSLQTIFIWVLKKLVRTILYTFLRVIYYKKTKKHLDR